MTQNKYKLVSTEYFTFISGPCAIESQKMAMMTAEFLKNISEKDIREINYLFAGSVKHYWPNVNLFEFSENWIIFFLQRIELQTKQNR